MRREIKTGWVVDFTEKFIEKVEYTNSSHCPWRMYDKHETEEECIELIHQYYEDLLASSKTDLKQVKRIFKKRK